MREIRLYGSEGGGVSTTLPTLSAFPRGTVGTREGPPAVAISEKCRKILDNWSGRFVEKRDRARDGPPSSGRKDRRSPYHPLARMAPRIVSDRSLAIGRIRVA